MPQPPALDPEGLLLELALRRALIQRHQAQAAVNAKANAGGRASIPELLVRGGILSNEVVAGLKAEVSAYLAQARMRESAAARPAPVDQLRPQTVVLPPTPLPGQQHAKRPGDHLSSSVVAPGEEPPTVPGGIMVSSGATPPSGIARPTATSASHGGGHATLPLDESGDPRTTRPDSSNAQTVNATRFDSGGSGGTRFKPVAGAKFGRYELISELGRGGMGVVFRARQADLEREVALKMLLDGGGASNVAVDRFYAEARHVAKLVHPGIVSIHDVGEHEGIHYFTMDFVEGQHLGHLIRSGDLDRKKTIDIAIKLCSALAYAHKQGVIHRDLKPGNILMDKRGSPRITDFGIAKDLGKESTSTRAGEVLGTPNYMPPEQADGRALHVDARADIYSLGAVLYEMLTGKPPFVGQTTFEIVTQVVHQKPTPPRKVDPEIPKDLETIVLKCLEKERERRYDDANALLRDLESFRDGDVIEAKAPGALVALRERGLAIGLGAAALVAVCGVAAFVIQVRHNEQLAQEQVEAERKKHEDELAAAAAKAKEEEELRRAAEKGSALVKDALEAEAAHSTTLAMQKALDAVQAAPRLVLAHETLARFYLELRKDAELARTEADAAIALDATSLDARKTRARALILAGRYDEALVDAQKIEDMGPDARGPAAAIRGETALAQRQPERAVRELEQAQSLLPRDPHIPLELAQAYFAARRFKDAEKAASDATRLDAGPTPLLLRAEARAKLGRAQEAQEDAREAQKRAPDDPRVQELLARLEAAPPTQAPDGEDARHKAAEAALRALQRGDRASAEAWLARPRDANDCSHVHSMRASVLWNLGRLADADAEFTLAIQKAKDKSIADYGNRGLVRNKLGHYQEALADFAVALKDGILPGMYPAAPGRAEALWRSGKFEDAEQAFAFAIDKAPSPRDRAETIHERAHERIAANRAADAIADLDEALKILPGNVHFLDVRGDAKSATGDTAGAVEDWQKALAGASKDAARQLEAKIAKANGKKGQP